MMYWFDQTKLEAVSRKRSLSEWDRIVYSTDYTLESYQSSNPPTFRTAKASLQRRLNAADLKLISSVISKSNKSAFQSLSELEFVALFQQFATQAFEYANEENERFYSTNEKYITAYQEMISNKLSGYGLNLNGNRIDFSKELKEMGLGIYSIDFFQNQLCKHRYTTIRYFDDFRFGRVYSILTQTITPKMHQQSLSNLANHSEHLQQQVQFFDTVFFETYLQVLNVMITDGFSLDEAKKVFPRA